MANTYLVDLGYNDTLQDVIRKVNSNFRRLSSNNAQQMQSGIRQEAERTDNVIAGVIGEVNAAVANGLAEIDSKVDESVDTAVKKAENKITSIIDDNLGKLDDKFEELEAKLEEKITELSIPPIGTCIICNYDPNVQWPGSTWIEVDDIYAIEAKAWRRVK